MKIFENFIDSVSLNDGIWILVRVVFLSIALVTIKSCVPFKSRELLSPRFPDFKNRYVSSISANEELIDQRYQYVLSKKDDKFIYRRFFPETFVLTLYEEYKSGKLNVWNGLYREYWDTGKPKSVGSYENGKRSKKWKFYDFDGSILEEGEYNGGFREGVWLDYYSSGKVEAKYNYWKGELDGEQILYDTTGGIINALTYRNGKLVGERDHTLFGVYKDSEKGSSEIYFATAHESLPLFSGCPNDLPYKEKKICAYQKLIQFLQSNLNYPSDAYQNGVMGVAEVSFEIEIDGSISNIRVLNGLCESITNELIRIVKMMPMWEPGTQDGKAVRVQFDLPVNFK